RRLRLRSAPNPILQESAPFDADSCLARFPAGSEFAMHWHTHTETVVVLEGAVDIVMDGTRYTATAGSYVVIPGKTHHAWFTHPDADAVLLARLPTRPSGRATAA
ncbi:MAG: cupin domain-containing protein, partial [Acidobacteria bacterium]|nr:cupin domain-containing protein [Acidobacteriota bacterium]